eukprot:gene156-212_t
MKPIRLESFNCRTLLTEGALEAALAHCDAESLTALLLQEARWEEEVWNLEVKSPAGNSYFLYGGKAIRNKAGARVHGCLTILSESAAKSVFDASVVNDRLVLVSLKLNQGRKLLLGNVYWPTATGEDEAEAVGTPGERITRGKLRKIINDEVPKMHKSGDVVLLGGDWNSEGVAHHEEEEANGLPFVSGREAMEESFAASNANTQTVLSLMQDLNMHDVSTSFRRRFRNRWTYRFNSRVYPRNRREYDRWYISHSHRNLVKDLKVFKPAFLASDHRPVQMEMTGFLYRPPADPLENAHFLRAPDVAMNIQQKGIEKNQQGAAGGGARTLADIAGSMDYEELEKQFVGEIETVMREEPPERIEKKRDWISDRTLRIITRRAQVEANQGANCARHIKALNKLIRKSARDDKRQWTAGLIQQAARARAAGDSKKTYEHINKLAGRSKGGAAEILPSRRKVFDDFYRTLFAPQHKSICPKLMRHPARADFETLLNDSAGARPKLAVDEAPPTLEELEKTIRKMKNGKCHSGALPMEIFKNSELALRVLHRQILKVWGGDPPSAAWLEAAVALIHKAGDKKEPGNYRPISLLSSGEKVLSQIVHNRLSKGISKGMMVEQRGFRPGYSTRHAAFVVQRAAERLNRKNQVGCFIYLDFSKAFDSLDHATMMKLLKWWGFPQFYCDVIQRMYDGASLRLRHARKPDELGAKISLGRGIRQGCGLSPSLFVVCVDAIMRLAAAPFGDSSFVTNFWLGYADDIVVKARSAKEAEAFLHRIQAIAAVTGLHLNAKKTVCQPVGEGVEQVTAENAEKERIRVKKGGDAESEKEGWIAHWSAAPALTTKQNIDRMYASNNFPNKTPTHLILYDDGEVEAVLRGRARGNKPGPRDPGWMTHQDGTISRGTHLGDRQFVNKQQFHVCPECGDFLDDAYALKCHRRVPHACRPDKTEEEKRRLRVTRMLARKRKLGKDASYWETHIVDIGGTKLECLPSFKYLGTTIHQTGAMREEINRRTGIARSAFKSLSALWRSKRVSRRLKTTTFKVMIIPILIYNAESWTLDKYTMRKLEKFYRDCLRTICDAKYIASTDSIREQLNMPSLANLLTERRLAWMGHVARQEDPLITQAMELEILENGDYWALIKEDYAKLEYEFGPALSWDTIKSMAEKSPGKFKTELLGEAPNLLDVPKDNQLDVGAIVVSASYRGQEFYRIGWYLYHDYEDVALREEPPPKIQLDKVQRLSSGASAIRSRRTMTRMMSRTRNGRAWPGADADGTGGVDATTVALVLRTESGGERDRQWVRARRKWRAAKRQLRRDGCSWCDSLGRRSGGACGSVRADVVVPAEHGGRSWRTFVGGAIASGIRRHVVSDELRAVADTGGSAG